MPLHPYSPTLPVFSGMHGWKLRLSMNMPPAPITISTTAPLITTTTLLTVTDSRTPNSSSAVTMTVTSTAGRLKTAVTGSPPGTFTSVPGAAASAAGKLMPSCDSRVTKLPDQPTATVAAPRAYSRIRSHPMTQATNSPRRVGVGVGRSRQRDTRGELGVTERGEDAGQPREHHGDDDRRPGVCRRSLAGEHEDAGADDRPDAEHDQLARPEDAAQPARPSVAEL